MGCVVSRCVCCGRCSEGSRDVERREGGRQSAGLGEGGKIEKRVEKQWKVEGNGGDRDREGL